MRYFFSLDLKTRALSFAAQGPEGYGIALHPSAFHGDDTGGDRYFIGVGMGNRWVRTRLSINNSVVLKVPGVPDPLLRRTHRCGQGHINEVATLTGLIYDTGSQGCVCF